MCVLELGNRGPQAYFFASIINSDRASFQDENCAGDAVTWQRERSRTLICEATWVCAQREEPCETRSNCWRARATRTWRSADLHERQDRVVQALRDPKHGRCGTMRAGRGSGVARPRLHESASYFTRPSGIICGRGGGCVRGGGRGGVAGQGGARRASAPRSRPSVCQGE